MKVPMPARADAGDRAYDSEAVNTRIAREVLRALDVYVARNPKVKNRQGAILRMVKSCLVDLGLLDGEQQQ